MSETHIKSQKKVDEVETFFPDGGTIKLPSFEKPFEVKKIKWGKEAQLGRLIGSLLKDANISQFGELTEKNIKANPQIVINAFLPLLETAPETVTKMVAILLDKAEVWVNENLSMPDIIEVLVPFFVGAFKKYQKLFGNINQRFQKQ